MHLRHTFLVLVLVVIGSRHVPGQFPPLRALEEVVPADQLLAAADFDGDGDPDLLTSGPDALLVNDGHANFAAAVSSPPFLAAGWVVAAAGDADGDARADVIAVRFLLVAGPMPAQETSLWRSTPAGFVETPGAVPPLPSGSLLDRIQLADLDGDLDLDAVVTTVPALSGTVPPLPGPARIWLNAGGGSFVEFPGALPAAAAAGRPILPADFDGDGDLDLLVVPPGTASARLLCWNNGSGAFSAGASLPGGGSCVDSLTAGDFDGNGLPDVAAQGGPGACPAPVIELHFNLGAGTFTVAVAAVEELRSRAVAADLDRDGRAELLRAGFGGLFAHGPAPFTGLGPVVRAWAVAGDSPAVLDFDGDGDVDLAVRTAQGIRMLLGDGQGDLVPLAGRIAAPPGLVPPVLGDADGDGDLDVIGARSGGTILGTPVLVAWNDGCGRFGWEPDAAPGPAPFAFALGLSRIEAGDLDGDGDADLVASGLVPAGGGGLQDAVLWNQGAAWTAGVALGAGGGATSAVRIADVDGDADLDLVALSNPAPTYLPQVPPLRVFRNDGTGAFAVSESIPAVLAGPDLAVLDADGDGDRDLVAARAAAPGAAALAGVLLLNDGLGGFSTGAGLPPVAFASVAAGDLDGDQDPDLLLDQRVLRNDGYGAFAVIGSLPGWTAASASPGRGPLLGDVDGDGDPDVVDRQGRLFRNLGGGVFSVAEAAVLSAQPVRAPAALADLDGDGDVDLLTDGPRVLLNVQRQLAPGKRARLGRPASLELFGPSGAVFSLWAAAGPAAIPLGLPGTLFLDPATLVPVFSGSFDSAGRAILEAFVPSEPALAGLRLFWQALTSTPAGPRSGNQVVTAF